MDTNDILDKNWLKTKMCQVIIKIIRKDNNDQNYDVK
jgi:hypothetical protein